MARNEKEIVKNTSCFIVFFFLKINDSLFAVIRRLREAVTQAG